MTTLTDYKRSEQLSLDELLAIVGQEEAVAVEDPVTTIEAEESDNGLCPSLRECETRRRRLPHYRAGSRCHWLTWHDAANCPVFKNQRTQGRNTG